MSDGFNSLIMSFLSELNSHLVHALFVTLSLSDRRHINFMGDDEKIKISVISRLSPYCLTKFCSEDIQMPPDKTSWMERRRKASLTVCRGGLREQSLNYSLSLSLSPLSLPMNDISTGDTCIPTTSFDNPRR